MNFYCCVHSSESLKTHIDYANQKFSRFVDKDIDYKFICGTKARDKFSEHDVINAYDGNPLAKYNQKLRNYTSMWHVLNNIEHDVFVFNQCTMFFKDIDFVNKGMGDIGVNIVTPGPIRNAPLPQFMDKFFLQGLRKHHTDESIFKFYNERFSEFNIFMAKYNNIPLYTCTLNPNNQFVKQLFDEWLSPFLSDDAIQFFNCDVAQWLLGHLYYTKYQDKIRLCKCLNISAIERTPDYQFMHYYGK